MDLPQFLRFFNKFISPWCISALDVCDFHIKHLLYVFDLITAQFCFAECSGEFAAARERGERKLIEIVSENSLIF